MADEGNSHLDSRAIKVRLRKPKKRLARKEWNLIRNSCSLVLPGSHEEARQRGPSGYAERDREKERCRAEITQPDNSGERETEKEHESKTVKWRGRRGGGEKGSGWREEKEPREKTRAVGYRQRRHNNQEYDNTRDGCLPSPQTSARMPSSRRG